MSEYFPGPNIINVSYNLQFVVFTKIHPKNEVIIRIHDRRPWLVTDGPLSPSVTSHRRSIIGVCD